MCGRRGNSAPHGQALTSWNGQSPGSPGTACGWVGRWSGPGHLAVHRQRNDRLLSATNSSLHPKKRFLIGVRAPVTILPRSTSAARNGHWRGRDAEQEDARVCAAAAVQRDLDGGVSEHDPARTLGYFEHSGAGAVAPLGKRISVNSSSGSRAVVGASLRKLRGAARRGRPRTAGAARPPGTPTPWRCRCRPRPGDRRRPPRPDRARSVSSAAGAGAVVPHHPVRLAGEHGAVGGPLGRRSRESARPLRRGASGRLPGRPPPHGRRRSRCRRSAPRHRVPPPPDRPPRRAATGRGRRQRPGRRC
jgi:hypothetical protein